MLVSDLITSAFLDLNEIAVGRTISTPEQTDAFARLNQMMDEWSAEQLMVPPIHGAFTLTGATDVYTLGTGGSLVTAAQPVRVTGAASVSGGFRSSVKIVSWDMFEAEVEDRISVTSVLAKILAADNGAPNINLRVHPIPASSPGTLWLDYWSAIAPFAAVTTAVSMPVAFANALHYNLALKLYPLYARPGITPLTLIEARARESKARIEELNAAVLGTRPGVEAGAPATGRSPLAPQGNA